MASARDSAERNLVGFEQGVNIKTIDQLVRQTRSRFSPLAHPKIATTSLFDRKMSVALRIKDIPTDPGDGKYTLLINSHKGSAYDLKIRTVGNLAATSVLTVNNTATAANLNNLTFVLSDGKNTVTFTGDNAANATLPGRTSATAWTVGLNGAADRAAIAGRVHATLLQINEEGELNIAPVLDGETVKLTNDKTGVIGNTVTSGTAISGGHITIPTFSGGRNGLLRTLNDGTLKHPIDATAYALGVLEPPTQQLLEATSIAPDIAAADPNQIKRVTFDIHKIINKNTATTGISSKIIYDDTLLIIQETNRAPDYEPVESGIGKKITQIGLNVNGLATLDFTFSNWKMVAKDVGESKFEDLSTVSSVIEGSPRTFTFNVPIPDVTEEPDVINLERTLLFSIHYTPVLGESETESFIVNWKFRGDDENVGLAVSSIHKVEFYALNLRSGPPVMYERAEWDPDEGPNLRPTLRVLVNFAVFTVPDDPDNELPGNSPVVQKTQAFFINLLSAINSIQERVPFKLSMSPDPNLNPAQENYTLEIEEKKRLTYCDIIVEPLGNKDTTLNMFSILNADWFTNSNNGFGFTLIDNSTRVFFRAHREYPDPIKHDRKNYLIGLNGVKTIRDVVNRVYDAINFAKSNSDLSIEPSQSNASTSLKVTNLSAVHGTSKLQSITLISTGQVSKSYVIVHGGANGQSAVKTGTVLAVGSDIGSRYLAADVAANALVNGRKYRIKTLGSTTNWLALGASSNTPTAGDIFTATNVDATGSSHGTVEESAVGGIAVNISTALTQWKLLSELGNAINHANGHNAGVSDSKIIVGSINDTAVWNSIMNRFDAAAERLHSFMLTQADPGDSGNTTIVSDIPTLTAPNFTGALSTSVISSSTIQLKPSSATGNWRPTFNKAGNLGDIFVKRIIKEQLIFTHSDFSAHDVKVNFRDGVDAFYYLKPDHSVEIMSFGFGSKTNDVKFYEDLSLHGERFWPGDFKPTLAMDPVMYLKSSADVRFPVQVNNLGSTIGFEYDGIIEPLEIRNIMLGRSTSDFPVRGIKSEMGGEYNYSKLQRSSELIHNNITYEKTSIVPFFDNCPTIAAVIGIGEAPSAESIARKEYVDVFYVKVPGIIFKNDKRIYPFIDTEERIFQAAPLNGNNPEMNEIDGLVSEVFKLGLSNNLLMTDDRNLGAETFRRRAGFDFSSNPHPGTDSIVFGGLRYV